MAGWRSKKKQKALEAKAEKKARIRAPRKTEPLQMPKVRTFADIEKYNAKLKAQEDRANLRKLAKRANQRLRRLEQALESPEKASYAYFQAAQYTNKDAIFENTRFREGTKTMTDAEVRKERRHIEAFLNSATSTATGVKKAVTSTNKKNMKSLGITAEELFRLYETMQGAWYKLARGIIGSKEVQRIVTTGQRNGKTEKEILIEIQEACNNELDRLGKPPIDIVSDLYKDEDEDGEVIKQ